uniref:Major facilitator superfamily (MFS) profile domain-containing protein n=1 Tax=Stomoxys calcitrans TaxID=35570 RepID=A0A1I8QBZ2_STOCA
MMGIELKTTTEEANAIAVYKDTTIPKKPKKPKKRDKSDLGPDFIAPDGGWGWVVCIAAGLSNLSLFPPLQQYGLIYRQRMATYGFDAKEVTTIVNAELALSSLVGLVNGAMFRRFTFRQVAIAGSLLAFSGILLSAFCETFVQYLICFSCTYGIGLGLCMAATSLAVNTYFKNKRRKATGFSWTLTGLGAIVFPHISTLLLTSYGAQGAILVYAAVVLNSFLCALTLQPVLRHSPKPPITAVATTQNDNYECEYCQFQKKDKRSIFSSEYVFNDDDPDKPGYEITEPGTPMIARANDGWFGSKLSLAMDKGPRYRSTKLLKQLSKQESYESDYDTRRRSMYKSNYFNREREEFDRYASKASVNAKSKSDGFHCTCAEEKALLQIQSEDMKREEEFRLQALLEEDKLAKSRMSFWQKVVLFFDLGLLKNFTFVNLAAGMTIMMFGEINFSVLTPFILNSFGYSDAQISLAMSLLAGMDIAVRFLAPLVLEKVKLGNQALFAIGIIIISIGRLVVTLTDSYYMILAVFVLIGFGKGFRTIFAPLIIPSYVPLNRLPAASGLQLILCSIISFSLGPLLGIITDSFGYAATIHSINALTCLTLLFWFIEYLSRRRLGKNSMDSKS